MTNGERADRLLAEASSVADEMRAAAVRHAWNLTLRRAQEVIELTIKGLLNELGVEYPRIHDPVPMFVESLQSRRIEADPKFLERLAPVSAHLARVRGPAFYQEIAVTEAEAREAIAAADAVRGFGEELLARLRRT